MQLDLIPARPGPAGPAGSAGRIEHKRLPRFMLRALRCYFWRRRRDHEISICKLIPNRPWFVGTLPHARRSLYPR